MNYTWIFFEKGIFGLFVESKGKFSIEHFVDKNLDILFSSNLFPFSRNTFGEDIKQTQTMIEICGIAMPTTLMHHFRRLFRRLALSKLCKGRCLNKSLKWGPNVVGLKLLKIWPRITSIDIFKTPYVIFGCCFTY